MFHHVHAHGPLALLMLLGAVVVVVALFNQAERRGQ